MREEPATQQRRATRHTEPDQSPSRATVFRLIGVVSVAMVLLAPSLGIGQEDVELTEEQRRLNNKAIKALKTSPPDTDKALKFSKAALLVGPPNQLGYLTRGRALQLAGDCVEAAQALDQAEKAPGVTGITSDQIQSRLNKYRTKLQKNCPGTLVVQCNNPEIELSVDGDELACETPDQLEPGEYTVTARLGEAEETTDVEVVGSETITIEMSIGTDSQLVVSVIERASGRIQRAATDGRQQQVAEYQRRERERLRKEKEKIAELKRASEQEGDQSSEQTEGNEHTDADGTDDQEVEEPVSADNGDPSDGTEETGEVTSPPRKRHPLAGFQGEVALNLPFGGYVVQARDGDLGGGFSYGVGARATVGYRLSPHVMLENVSQFDYLLGAPFGLETVEGEQTEQQINFRTWRLFDQARTWFSIFNVGVFGEYRSQIMSFDPNGQNYQTPTFSAGPSIGISTMDLERTEGYLMIDWRWAPLFAGTPNMWTLQVSTASRHAKFIVEYSRMYGTGGTEGAFRKGETLTFMLGLRIPYRF